RPADLGALVGGKQVGQNQISIAGQLGQVGIDEGLVDAIAGAGGPAVARREVQGEVFDPVDPHVYCHDDSFTEIPCPTAPSTNRQIWVKSSSAVGRSSRSMAAAVAACTPASTAAARSSGSRSPGSSSLRWACAMLIAPISTSSRSWR